MENKEELQQKISEEIAKLKAKGYSEETINNVLGKTITMGLQGKSKKDILINLVADELEKEGY